jgi:hypothetical protein
MPQAVMGHGQKEEVKPIELPLSSLEALVEDRHRLGILPRPIEDDSPRVEGHLLPRGQLHGPETQLQGGRSKGTATKSGTNGTERQNTLRKRKPKGTLLFTADGWRI